MQDDDPYVRKTAAICVAKLFDINAELVQDRGFLDTLVVSCACTSCGSCCFLIVHRRSCSLHSCKETVIQSTFASKATEPRNFMQDLLGDSNPMVVANALCALTEIRENSSYEVVQFTPQLLFKLLRALNECTEWGQVCAPHLQTYGRSGADVSMGATPPGFHCKDCLIARS